MNEKQAEKISDILVEMRKFWEEEDCEGGNPPHFWLEVIDRIKAACQREAAKLIPAREIKFFDGQGIRQVSWGWVKQGDPHLAEVRHEREEQAETEEEEGCSDSAVQEAPQVEQLALF